MRYVIIGNGVAGIYAAETIRQLDDKGEIIMIGDETFAPYCRPMISLVLEGAISPGELPIRNGGFYHALNITPILGSRVTRIDAENRSVFIRKGEKFQFDKLLIASGADPRPIRADGLDLKNIFFMRTQSHVQEMLKALPHAKNALVLGGGLVGFKAAYGLMHQGLDVTMLIRSGYPLSMQVDETAGKMILDTLVKHGLKVRVGVEVMQFEGSETVRNARLSDGTQLPCDMVVVGKGVLPALSFVPRDQIEADLGILVSSRMETSVPGIFAAGDVAESVDIARKTRWVNAIWPEAVAQGRIAGMNMAGRPLDYKGSLGRNVIRMSDLDVMSGGLVNPPPDAPYEILSHTDPGRNVYRKLVFQEDKLVGMALVNAIEQGGVLLSLIQSETCVRVAKEKLLEPSFNYKRLMA